MVTRRQKTVPVDMSKLGERVAERRSPNKVGLPHGYQELPYDLPVMMEVERVMAEVGDPPAMGLIGWILEVGCYLHGHHNVWVKFYRDPVALVVEVNGDEVFKWVQHPDDKPAKLRQVIDKMSEDGGNFVAANDIEPGDEVLEGDVPGTYEIKREPRRRKRKDAPRPMFVEGDDVID